MTLGLTKLARLLLVALTLLAATAGAASANGGGGQSRLDAAVPRPADLSDRDPVPGHDVRRPLQHRLRQPAPRLLRNLGRSGRCALLHAADRGRRRRAGGRDPRRDDAARRLGPALRFAQPRSRRPRADEARHARDHVGGLREPADRPVGARVRPRRPPAARVPAAVRLPAGRRRQSRRAPEPRLRECRGPAQRPLPLHRHRGRGRAGRAAVDPCRRQPRSPAPLRPQAGDARPAVRLLDRSDRGAARAGDAVRGQRPRRAAAAEQELAALDGALVLGRRTRTPATRSSSTASRCSARTTSTASTASPRLLASVRPAEKTLLLDLDVLGIPLDNVEGMAFGKKLPDGRRSLILVSDNNFSPTAFTQFLLFAVSNAEEDDE